MSEKFEYYRNKSLEQLKLINPKWAYGENRNKILDIALKGRNKEYRIFLVNTSKLIENSIFADVELDFLFNGKEKNDMRITRILSRWDNNEFVDPPTICIDQTQNSIISFRDGQHRAKLSYFLGLEKIPVGSHNEDIVLIKKSVHF